MVIMEKESMRMTYSFFSITIFFVMCIVFFVACGRGSRGRGKGKEPAITNYVQKYINDVSTYKAGLYNIPVGVDIQQIIYYNNPILQQKEQESGLGGSKLIGEMSADAVGIYLSCPTETVDIPIGTPEELHLASPQDPNNIVIGILNNNVSVYVNSIESCGIIDALMGIFSGDAVSPLRVTIDVTNITNITQVVVIEQGQMLEAEKEDVQNIVVCKRAVASVPPGCSETMTLECMCAAHHRGPPVGSRAKLTPYRLDAPSSVFEKQQRVWDFLSTISVDPLPHASQSATNNTSCRQGNSDKSNRIGRRKQQRNISRNIENSRRNQNQKRSRKHEKEFEIVFYAWGKGDRTPYGTSLTGHAFVDIPTIGPVGYSVYEKESLDELVYCKKAKVMDETKDVPYAVYHCAIKISEQQKKRAIAKYQQWKDNPPGYVIGHNDCTSFVLDIADAAGVKYGHRLAIQTPVGFLQALIEHNPQ